MGTGTGSSKYEKPQKQFINTKLGGTDQSFFYTNSSDKKLAVHRPETTPDQSRGSLRFDSYSSFRNIRMQSELKKFGNLGPGTYDFHDYTNRPKTVAVAGSTRSTPCFNSVARKDLPVELDAIFDRPQGPPPGTYNVPRIMGFEGYDGAEIGKVIRSPFTATGGRHKEIDLGGDIYLSQIQKNSRRHMGPGFYDLPDEWTPSSFFKYNKKYPRTETRRSQGYEKPWTPIVARRPIRAPVTLRPPIGKRSLSGVEMAELGLGLGSRGIDHLDEGAYTGGAVGGAYKGGGGDPLNTSQLSLSSQDLHDTSPRLKTVSTASILMTSRLKRSQRNRTQTSELARDVSTIRNLPQYHLRA